MKILRDFRSIAVALAIVGGVAVSTPAAAQQPAPSAKPADKPAGAAAPAKPADKPAAAPAKPAGTTQAAAAKPADAKALLASADKKFKANDFAGALSDYEASNTAKPSPEAQRGIALSHDNLNHYPEAVAAYEKLIADNPPKMKDEVEQAKKRVEAIKAMPGKVHVEANPPAAIGLDGQPPGDKTTPQDLELAPGKHKITLSAQGYENADKEIDVTYASKQDVKVDLVAKPPPPPPPPVVAEQPPPPPPPPPAPPPEPRSKVPAYVTGAVAIVAAGVGTGFGIKALSQSNDFNNDPSKRTTKRADDGENNALVADMMFGIAITFGVTSAVLFLSSDEPKSSKAAPKATVAKKKVTVTPTPYISPTGGGLGANVKF